MAGDASPEAALTSLLSASKGFTLTPLAPYPFPQTYLLTVDNANILLDCGALDSPPESLPSDPETPLPSSEAHQQAATEYLDTLRKLAPTLNLVLLTHPLVSSLGLLPWLKSRCGLRCPVYATLPTREMGKWAVEEWVEARTQNEKNEARIVVKKTKKALEDVGGAGGGKKRKKGKGKEVAMVEDEDPDEDGAFALAEDEEERDPWDAVWQLTKEEVAEAFIAINAVRFTQPVHLSGPLKGYTLVSHRSGHTLGGTLFTLRPSLSSSLTPASSSSSFLYAPKFNHLPEHHLDRTALFKGRQIDEGFKRMGVVVVGAERSGLVNVKRVDREKALTDLMKSTLASGHSLLLPSDPSGRLIELLVLLEQMWKFEKLGQRHPLVLISKTGKDVVAFLSSLTEWLGGGVQESAGGVLHFGNLKIYPSIADLARDIPEQIPKLIVTVPNSLSHGPSRDLFIHFAQSPGNVVLLTGKSEEGTLARWVWGLWEERQEDGSKMGMGKVGEVVRLDQKVTLEVKRKVYLSGDELAAHEEREQAAADALARRQKLLLARRALNADDYSDSDSDASSGDEEDEPAELDFEPSHKRRKIGGFAGGAGAWDEFLDSGITGGGSAGAGAGGAITTGMNFDIYVKGSYARRGEGGQGGLVRFRMFPVVERKRRVDAYGEAIDAEGWVRRAEDEGGVKKVVGVPAGALKREEVQEPPEPPHKYVVDPVEVNMQCSIYALDMEGLTDGRTLEMVLASINPRKLVVVDGSPDKIDQLANHCRSQVSMASEIYTPALGECITVGEETKSFSVRLGDSIMASLKMTRVDDYDVAYVSGTVHFDAESAIPILERSSITDGIALAPAAAGESSATITQIEPDPSDDAPSTPSAVASRGTRVLPPLAPSLFIGDLRLQLLKDRLNALSVPSEFAGEGLLVCGPAPAESFAFVSSAAGLDPRKGAKAIKEATEAEAVFVAGGKVAVRKVGSGRLIIDGNPGETFQVVRKVVYSLHAHAG